MSTAPTHRQALLANSLAQIDTYLAASPSAQAAPGLTLAITDRERLLAVRNLGYANLETKTPVTDKTLFEFGSIGKSFTAICLLHLAEEGIVDLHAPVTAYLPWFSVRSRYQPITLHHLLSHASGLVCGSDASPDQRYEVWALRETEAAEPGVKARYSNVGYKVLSLVLEAVTGMSYANLVTERILAPLGMDDTVGVITHAIRPRLAVAYADAYSDRPWRPAYGFVPAVWLETNSGDGCLAATASDLASYLRMFLNGGAGLRGRVLSDASFTLMTTPHATFASGDAYGYGLFVGEPDGHHIGHGGGMVGYSAAMLGDLDAGIGVIVLKNAMQATDDIAEYALQTIISGLAGEPLPEPPSPPELNLSDYVGAYQDGANTFQVAVEADQLVLNRGSERVLLEPLGIPPEPDHFLAMNPDDALVPFRFERDETGSVAGLVHGANWYPAAWFEGPTAFDTPAEWSTYPGHYRSYNPWIPEFRVVLRQGVLRLIWPWGEEMPLLPEGEGFRVDGEPEGPEYFIFDTVVNGQALRTRSPGGETYYRFFTP